MMTRKDILRISDLHGPEDYSFGEKGLRLRELRRFGINVPDGILLSVEFLQRLIESMGIRSDIKRVMQDESRGVVGLDKFVRDILQTKTPPPEFKTVLENALQSIEDYGPDILYAVRSAALGEDDGRASFAGQYSTVLDVGFREIWDALFECYASWWTDRSVLYRKNRNRFFSVPGISIIIQRQLNPDFSGVLFTRHPVTASDITVIEATTGIGEKLVSGEVTPARWKIHSRSKKIISFESDLENKGSEVKEEHLNSLVEIGQKTEKVFGKGLDIEWCIENNIIFLTQMRPISSQGLQITAKDSTANIYSRSIVEDLWADRMTDMTASIIFDELSDLYTFKGPLKKLKLDVLAEIRAIRVINGYGYLSCKSVSELLKLLPKFLRFREIRKVFPPAFRDGILQTPFNTGRVLRLLHRVPLLFSDLAILPFLTVPLLKRHMINIERQLNSVDIRSYQGRDFRFYAIELERLLTLLAGLQIRNQWGYGNASVFTWLSAHFAVTFAGKSEPWILGQLADIPDNVTLRIQKGLLEISRACDKELIDNVFSLEDSDEGWRILQDQYKNQKATKMLREFILQYGFRSANRDFIHPRWEEKPGLVLELLKVALKAPSYRKKASHNHGIMERRTDPIQGLITAPFLTIFLRTAKRFLALREDLRFALDKVFYRIRKLLVEINNTCEFKALQKTEDGIFFLKLNELRSILTDHITIKDLLPGVERRMKSFFEDQKESPPYYIMHDGLHTMELSQSSGEINSFKCVAASPGVVEGRARIIRNPSEFNKLQEGEILIAYNTDPGWTPLFITAAGVAVEMGGILNHCAIVAREYGVPAVVGIEGITGKIRDGQLVRVDGINGVLSILT